MHSTAPFQKFGFGLFYSLYIIIPHFARFFKKKIKNLPKGGVKPLADRLA